VAEARKKQTGMAAHAPFRIKLRSETYQDKMAPDLGMMGK